MQLRSVLRTWARCPGVGGLILLRMERSVPLEVMQKQSSYFAERFRGP